MCASVISLSVYSKLCYVDLLIFIISYVEAFILFALIRLFLFVDFSFFLLVAVSRGTVCCDMRHFAFVLN